MDRLAETVSFVFYHKQIQYLLGFFLDLMVNVGWFHDGLKSQPPPPEGPLQHPSLASHLLWTPTIPWASPIPALTTQSCQSLVMGLFPPLAWEHHEGSASVTVVSPAKLTWGRTHSGGSGTVVV